VGTREGKVFELSGITGSNTSTGPLATCHIRNNSTTFRGLSSDPRGELGNGGVEERKRRGRGVVDLVVSGQGGCMSMAVNPSVTRNEVCTVGEDGQVLIWDLELQQATKIFQLFQDDNSDTSKVPLSDRMGGEDRSPVPLSKCCYAPGGNAIVVATRRASEMYKPQETKHSDANPSPDGVEAVIALNDLILLRRERQEEDDMDGDGVWKKEWSTPIPAGGDHVVCDMCFSPLGRRVAVGCTNGVVYVCDSSMNKQVNSLLCGRVMRFFLFCFCFFCIYVCGNPS
jgi:WD40 repeat protein